MKIVPLKSPRWLVWTAILVMAVWMVGCSVGTDTGKLAQVDRVAIDRRPSNPPRYFVIASGQLPDDCTQIGRSRQERVASTIKVRLYTREASGAACLPKTRPFRETIRLDVKGLSAGSYAVEVNGAVNSLILIEDH
jgi:inhibitor of cysteine peptidase